MSYILEALRKSDQERQRGAAPTLLAAPAAAVAPRQPALLAYGLLALVLLGAGVAIGWLRPWQADQAAPAVRLASKPAEVAPTQAIPNPAASKQAAPSAAAPVPGVTTLPAAVQSVPPAPVRASATAHAPARAPEPTSRPELALKSEPQGRLPSTPASSTPAAPSPLPIPDQARVSAAAAIPGTTQHAAISGKAVEAAPGQRVNTGTAAPAPSVVSMAELPIAIQQELPPMSISVHAYSAKPAERLVGINNRLLREGAEVAPGLALESITPDGMILSYKGYSFRRGVH